MMKKFLGIFIAALLCCGCDWHEDVYFDTPFAYIFDNAGGSTATIDSKFGKGVESVLTELKVSISVSETYFSEPITVDYEVLAGNGLKEGIDYKIQPSTASPLAFTPGTYTLPVRIMWLKTDAPDSSKDNTLTIRLIGSSLDGMELGYPGPSHKGQAFVFTKI
ncbi:MAG TPA: hypothetical protein DD383_02045 [Rikenellaceae bacterium]|nr:hypothetical protein [Rikenellaceae bacterium]HCQ73157.1 hypothetical protein [Rikenellaceae bacterium]